MSWHNHEFTTRENPIEPIGLSFVLSTSRQRATLTGKSRIKQLVAELLRPSQFPRQSTPFNTAFGSSISREAITHEL